MSACDGCLRRGHLLGLLAPHIAGLLDRPGRRRAGLLGLDDEDLIAAVRPGDRRSASTVMESFDPSTARARLSGDGIRAICRHDRLYPARLNDLVDPPAVLFVASALDDLSPLASDSVAIVGARRASGYAREVAHQLGRELSGVGLTVVSGLALGIDGDAHRGALAAGGLPVAVVAGGVDVPYPRSHRRLHEEVVACGAVVSELPPGCRPLRWSFPARNRIMAALAELTVVVEAAPRSGSLITCDFAADLQRPVGSVPGLVTSTMAEGSNALLRDGAFVVTGAADVLEELYGVSEARRLLGSGPRGPTVAGADRLLLEAVEAGLDVEAACEHAGLPAREGRAGLSRLEALGVVRRSALGGYQRTAGPAAGGRRA